MTIYTAATKISLLFTIQYINISRSAPGYMLQYDDPFQLVYLANTVFQL